MHVCFAAFRVACRCGFCVVFKAEFVPCASVLVHVIQFVVHAFFSN